jgi:nucleotide-binding universal stress UspA family protein
MFRKILVPLDGSSLAEKALPYATSLAEKYSAELILAQALSPLPVMPVGEFGVLPYDFGPIHAKEEERAIEYLSNAKEKLATQGIPARTAVIKGRSEADAIVDLAGQEEVDLIVKTTHGRSGLSRWVYGGVATKVLQQAPCPVLLVRIRAEDRSS